MMKNTANRRYSPYIEHSDADWAEADTQPVSLTGAYMKCQAFISYSRLNSPFANALTKLLSKAQIPYFFDRRDITRDDPNFDQDIRQAILSSFVFILLATPSSVVSPYVQGELDLAMEHGIPVIVLWVAGGLYTDTVPAKLTRHNRIDCRGQLALNELPELIDDLRVRRDANIPGVFLKQETLPEYCYPLTMSNGAVYGVRADAHNTFVDLLIALDDMSPDEQVSHLCYGQSWVISFSYGDYQPVAVPVQKLLHADQRWYTKSPASLGLIPRLHPNAQVHIAPMDSTASLFVLAIHRDEFQRIDTLNQQNPQLFERYARHFISGNHVRPLKPDSLNPTEVVSFVMMSHNPALRNMLVAL